MGENQRRERDVIRLDVFLAGWGVMEVIATRVVPLWVNARGVEFSWSSLQTGLDANITLVRPDHKSAVLVTAPCTCVCTCVCVCVSTSLFLYQIYLTATVTLLWLWSRADLNQALLPLLLCLLLSLCYSPLLLYLFSTYLSPDMWLLLAIRSGVGLVTGGITLLLFGAMNNGKKTQ